MNKLIVMLTGAKLYNEFDRDEFIIDVEHVIETDGCFDIDTIIKNVNKATNGNYYITGFKHIYTVCGDIYITEYNEKFQKIKKEIRL